MVEYFKLNEKKHPVRINRRVIIAIEKKTGKGLQALAEMDTQTMTDLIYMGIEEGYRFLKQINPFKNQEEFENELDEVPLMEFYDKSSKVITDFFQVKEKEN